MHILKWSSSLWIFSFLGSIALASEQVGTITQLQGTVKIFSHPSKVVHPEGPVPQALYEGEYFLVQEAKIGDSVEKGNILRTAPGSKARLVFENGDQINVGSGTAYRVSWDKDSVQAHTDINLMYGKLRGIVAKGGPRSHLQIRTKTAVMGVRGTDFFIAEGGKDETTEVSIIRGKVEVTPTLPKAKPIEVKAGYSASVTAPEPVSKSEKRSPSSTESKHPALVEPVVELRKTTQEDFKGIQKSSTISQKAKPQSTDEASSKVVEKLEKKAVETTLKDIQTGDKKLYASLQGKEPPKSVDDLNQTAIQTLLKEAPKAPPKRKPYQSELEDLEDGAYEKYFKSIDP